MCTISRLIIVGKVKLIFCYLKKELSALLLVSCNCQLLITTLYLLPGDSVYSSTLDEGMYTWLIVIGKAEQNLQSFS